LTWDLVGDDYAERANWIWTTIKYFHLDKQKPRNLAIFFLSVFGFACEDQKDHYENSNSLSFYQYSILEDLHNHTDWDYFTDSFPIDFRDGKRTFLTLAQAICCCLTHQSEEFSVSPMLEKMFKVPGQWLRDNVASFLLFCNETLILHYIGEMVLAQDFEKATQLLLDMIIVSERFDNELSSEKGVGKVFAKICRLGSPTIRQQFYDQTWNTISKQALNITEEDGEFEIIEDFGYLLMDKAYDKLPVKLFHEDDEIMEIEE